MEQEITKERFAELVEQAFISGYQANSNKPSVEEGKRRFNERFSWITDLYDKNT